LFNQATFNKKTATSERQPINLNIGLVLEKEWITSETTAKPCQQRLRAPTIFQSLGNKSDGLPQGSPLSFLL
jgi:hypothetical protein